MAEDPGLLEAVKSVGDRLDQLITLQRAALLGPDRTLDFIYEDREMRLWLPQAESDAIQRRILATSCFYEEHLLAQVTPYVTTDTVVFDVGANIGNHTVYFGRARGAARIVAIEPQSHCFEVLERNVALNRINGVQAVNCAVGQREGRARIMRAPPSDLGATAFVETEFGGRFRLLTLNDIADQYSESRVDFIKIDVDGMQPEILEGARAILGDLRPVIWVGLGPESPERAQVTEMLAEFHYSARPLDAENLIFEPRG